MEELKSISNINLRSRVIQIIVLFAAIIIGIVISETAAAQSYHREKARHFKSMYQDQIKKSDRICSILEKKRNQLPKATLFASNRKPKYRPMAEVDSPGTRREN